MHTLQTSKPKINPYTLVRQSVPFVLWSLVGGAYLLACTYTFTSNVWAEGPGHSLLNFLTGFGVLVATMTLFILFLARGIPAMVRACELFAAWYHRRESEYNRIED